MLYIITCYNKEQKREKSKKAWISYLHSLTLEDFVPTMATFIKCSYIFQCEVSAVKNIYLLLLTLPVRRVCAGKESNSGWL